MYNVSPEISSHKALAKYSEAINFQNVCLDSDVTEVKFVRLRTKFFNGSCCPAKNNVIQQTIYFVTTCLSWIYNSEVYIPLRVYFPQTWLLWIRRNHFDRFDPEVLVLISVWFRVIPNDSGELRKGKCLLLVKMRRCVDLRLWSPAFTLISI